MWEQEFVEEFHTGQSPGAERRIMDECKGSVGENRRYVDQVGTTVMTGPHLPTSLQMMKITFRQVK